MHGLHVCIECDSTLVYPTDWEEEGPDKWFVELHCPNCDWTGGGIFEQDLLDEFDEELDRGMEELAADLGRLARANMADDVDRFVAASESAFKNELVKRNVSQQRIQREVDAFRSASQPRTPLVREIRSTDRQIGNAMLNILALYESEWGRWRYDAQSGKVLFSDAATLGKYTDYLDQIGASARQQLALQRRLLDIQPPRTGTR